MNRLLRGLLASSGLLGVMLGTSACGSGFFGPLIQSGKASVFTNPDVPRVTYKTIAVIAADETDATLRISAIVREKLKERGVDAQRRSGRWPTEPEAIARICADQTQPVQGVLLVAYDTIYLHECETKAMAFRVQGNGNLTLDQMAAQLVKYIRDVAPPPGGTSFAEKFLARTLTN